MMRLKTTLLDTILPTVVLNNCHQPTDLSILWKKIVLVLKQYMMHFMLFRYLSNTFSMKYYNYSVEMQFKIPFFHNYSRCIQVTFVLKFII